MQVSQCLPAVDGCDADDEGSMHREYAICFIFEIIWTYGKISDNRCDQSWTSARQ